MQDLALVLSENQAVTTSAASTNMMNEGAVVNTGYPMIAEFRVTKDFGGSGTLTCSIEAGKQEAFTNKITLGASGAVDASELKKGKVIRVPIAFNPNPDYPYTRAYYTASATLSGGTITCVIQPAVQTNMED